MEIDGKSGLSSVFIQYLVSLITVVTRNKSVKISMNAYRECTIVELIKAKSVIIHLADGTANAKLVLFRI